MESTYIARLKLTHIFVQKFFIGQYFLLTNVTDVVSILLEQFATRVAMAAYTGWLGSVVE